jgi:hypothetical protein
MSDERSTGSKEVSREVVRAVAEDVGVPPTELEPPLYDAVDPEALDALYESGAGVRVEFQYADRSVVVHPDGSVTVAEVPVERFAVSDDR